MLVEPVEARARARAAQRQVERANRVEPGEPLVPFPADQRMLEQGQQRDRRQILGRGGGDASSSVPAGVCGQRLAGAVVGLDPPALEMRRDPRGKRRGRA